MLRSFIHMCIALVMLFTNKTSSCVINLCFYINAFVPVWFGFCSMWGGGGRLLIEHGHHRLLFSRFVWSARSMKGIYNKTIIANTLLYVYVWVGIQLHFLKMNFKCIYVFFFNGLVILVKHTRT